MARHFFKKEGSLIWINIPDGAAALLKQSYESASVSDKNTGLLTKKMVTTNEEAPTRALAGVPAETSSETPPIVATLGNKGI